MNFNKPKGFGEILDHTFRLSKNRFTDFFLIFLVLLGPVYLVQAIIQLFSGASFFREIGSGNVWYEQIISSFSETGSVDSSNLGLDLGTLLIGLLSLLLFPVAEAAVLLAINHIRNEEEYTIGSVLKRAFSKFSAIFFSNILFGFITFGLVIIPLIIVFLGGLFSSEMVNPIAGILFGIVLFFGFLVGIGYLLTRWSFYFGSVVLDGEAPGLSRSWRLTQKNTWKLMGLYIVLYFIITSISFAVEVSFSLFLGNSVLLTIIANIVTLITTMFFTVGYAVIYLDLKTRHDADDLKEMIEDYNALQ